MDNEMIVDFINNVEPDFSYGTSDGMSRAMIESAENMALINDYIVESTYEAYTEAEDDDNKAPGFFGKLKNRISTYFTLFMNVVKKFLQEVAEQYKNGHFGCNFNGEHEKCKDCCITNCKKRNAIWFGLDVTDTDVGNKWIPCSERLPEEYGEYLVWWTDITRSQYYEIVEYEPSNGWIGDIPQAVEGKYSVIAWQPLPEPYKERD